MAKIIQNDCVDCGLPCLYETCPFWAYEHFYCDDCNDEAPLYKFDGQELCIDCIIKRLEVVE